MPTNCQASERASCRVEHTLSSCKRASRAARAWFGYDPAGEVHDSEVSRRLAERAEPEPAANTTHSVFVQPSYPAAQASVGHERARFELDLVVAGFFHADEYAVKGGAFSVSTG